MDPDSYLPLSAFRQGMDECGLRITPNTIHFAKVSPKAFQELGERLAGLPEEQRPDAVVCHELSQAEVLMDVFSRHGLPLQGAGTTLGVADSRALQILADGRMLGSVAAELLTSRLTRPQRPHMRVGIKMRYRAQFQDLRDPKAKPAAAPA